MKSFIFLILMTLCYSCMDVFYLGDRATSIKANGYNSLIFNSDCGNVDFSPSQWQHNIEEATQKSTIYLKHYFKTENFTIYTDSFKVKKEKEYSKIDNVLFMRRDINQASRKTKPIKQKIYQVNANEVIFVSFDVYTSKDGEEIVMVLPCNYIMCKDKPIITDTIRIQLKK